MIEQFFFPLNSMQKSMYIILLQQLRLQKSQGQHECYDLLKYFISLMVKRWSAAFLWSTAYILFILV